MWGMWGCHRQVAWRHRKDALLQEAGQHRHAHALMAPDVRLLHLMTLCGQAAGWWHSLRRRDACVLPMTLDPNHSLAPQLTALPGLLKVHSTCLWRSPTWHANEQLDAASAVRRQHPEWLGRWLGKLDGACALPDLTVQRLPLQYTHLPAG